MRWYSGILLSLVMLIAGSLSACFNLERVTKVQYINVVSNPPGAWIEKSDAEGRKAIGQTPTILEKRYVTTVKRFKHWNWLWPALFGLCIGGGANMSEEEGGAPLIGVCALGLVTTLIVDIVGEAKSGRELPPMVESIQLSASLDHHLTQSEVLTIPSSTKNIEFNLPPVALSTPAMRPQPAPVVVKPYSNPPVTYPPQKPVTESKPISVTKRFIVAVFDVEDAAKRFPDNILNQLTEYLAAKLTEEAHFRIIPRHQLRARIVEEKKEGYKKCYEESCQIELGKALAAEKSLATKLLQFGNACAISSTLYDLKSEATEKAASIRTDCSENGLMEGMEKIAKQLANKNY